MPQQKKPQNPSVKDKKGTKTSKSLIKRLPVYLRILDNLIRRDVDIISSRVLSDETGFTAEQIRKDLATFGAFGTRGTGYNTSYLREKLLKITGLDKQIRIVVVGSGHLGKALTRYNILKNPYVEIAGIFDANPAELNTEILGIKVQAMEDMPRLIEEQSIKVAMITVPAEVAQAVVDLLVENGISAILNFAPTKLRAPAGVHIHNADLTIELQSLIYYSLEREKE
ncbi:MAG: redox-sensing transcriptional repressor Rex [Dethiobacter sp.]|mgnify:CR=1 FL=1|jgi:redox-sensing transcriptional repressor|nr:redox-sensing transcriptional repressor Rex [Dethiobacter sp.]MBS3898490.1 redox-sensing transcriptional repressor Rex [Dethiobacter sp.]MCL4463509.1 redox-sensing transcriptional repressor Rex [Bacillota bacterium]